MFGLGMTELVVILIIVLVLFGAKRLPEMGGALGKGLKAFKKEFSDLKESLEEDSSSKAKDTNNDKSSKE